MPSRWIRVVPASALADGLKALRREAGVPEAFPADVLAEAQAAASAPLPERERVDIPFVTIDPPGARDLDQALHIGRRGRRVSRSLRDRRSGAFVAPGGAIDRDTHTRGVTVYAPDRKVPLHPPVLSEGAASLLPGEWRPAVLWTLDLDERGELIRTEVARVQARSVSQHTYEDVPASLAPLLREVGERRLAIERERGGVRLAVPEQEVVRDGDGWTVALPRPAGERGSQRPDLAAHRHGRGRADVAAGVGILRTQPPPDERALARLRRTAIALGVDWPQGVSYAEFVRGLDPSIAAHAAVMHEATGVGRGAAYTPFDGAPPAETEHFAVAAPYAHATAPLRRLQDRYVSECCLAAYAGVAPPDWVRAGLAGLPAAMSAGTRRANAVERGVVDLVEAVLLAGREGERFDAVVIDEGLLQLRDPAVRGD